MVQTITTTDKEKFMMYNKLSKKELINMLIESNKHLQKLIPKIINFNKWKPEETVFSDEITYYFLHKK